MGNFERITVADDQFVFKLLSANVPSDQFLRELLVNSIEANASEIRMIASPLHLSHGIYKLTIIDNGCGMSMDEMEEYLSSIAAGGKLRGLDANFGMGLKIATLPYNPAGVEYYSWQNGIGHRVVISYDADTAQYGVLRGENGRLAERITDEAKLEPIVDHGTMVVLHGQNTESNTIRPTRDDGKRVPQTWIGTYINKRFYALPDNLKLAAQELNKDDTLVNASQPITGAHYYLEHKWCPKGHKGTITVGKTKYHWWIKDPNATAYAYAYQGGYSAVLYRSELYEAITGPAHGHRLIDFGVTFGQRNLVIIVEPHESMIHSNHERTSVSIPHGKDGELPWADWGATFREHMPEEITEMLADEMSERSKVDEGAVDERVRQKYSQMKFKAYKPTPKGNVLAEDEYGSTMQAQSNGSRQFRRAKPKTTPTPSSINISNRFLANISPNGEPAVEVEDRTPIPKILWCETIEQVEENGVVDRPAIVSGVNDERTLIHANPYFRVFESIREGVKEALTDPEAEPIIEAALREEVEERLKLCYMHANYLLRPNRDLPWQNEEKRNAMSPEAFFLAITMAADDILSNTRRKSKAALNAYLELKAHNLPESSFENVNGEVVKIA